MDFHKKAKEVDKVFELFFRLWVSGSHEQGKKLLAAHGERCYRAGMEVMRDATYHLVPIKYRGTYKELAARLLKPKEGEKET